MPIKKNIFLITALFYILYLVFPLFGDTFHIPVWLPSMAVVAVMVVLYPQAFANRTFYWFLVYAMVLGLYVIVGKRLTIGIGTVADNKKIFVEFAYILPTISMFSVIAFLKDINLIKKLVLWFLIFFFSSFIVVYPMMLKYNTLREAYFEQNISFTIAGLPSYSLMHSYVFVIPVLCYAFKVVKHQYKWLVGIAIMISFLVILRTDVGACILLALFIIVTALFYKKNRSVGYWLIIFIVVFILFILYNLYFADAINWILPFVENSSFEKKLIDFQKAIVENHSSMVIDKRERLHQISWDSFFNNPLIGSSVVGGHSTLIDRLGGMGLLAFIPFFMIFVSFIKQIKSLFQTKKAREFFYLGVIAGFILMYQKGLWGAECWLMYMVLMPCGILMFEREMIRALSSKPQ